MRHVVLTVATVLSFASASFAQYGSRNPGSSYGRGHNGSNYQPYSAPMHFYMWPNGTYGFESPTITYGVTPSTVYSPWLFSPYSYRGYGNYGLGGYGWGGGY